MKFFENTRNLGHNTPADKSYSYKSLKVFIEGKGISEIKGLRGDQLS